MADRENRQHPAELRPVPSQEWPRTPEGLREVWRSMFFLVQVYDVPDYPYMLRASVQRVTDAGFRRSASAGATTETPISWDELQDVKRQIGREHACAVEVYPPSEDAVIIAPMRHLWFLPELPMWAWSANGGAR